VSPLRNALAAHLGQVLTPEVAAAIECGQTAPWPSILDPETGKFLVASQSPQDISAWIEDTACALIAAGGQQDFKDQTKHTFLNGVYMRELFIPKGTMLIGKVHRLDCMNIVAKGDISILTENGSARVKAGHTAISLAGIQKVGYAHEDTVFINVFRTDETRIEAIEDAVAFPAYSKTIARNQQRGIL
jgi:hypothetical protein